MPLPLDLDLLHSFSTLQTLLSRPFFAMHRFLLIGFSSLVTCFCAPAQEQYVVVYMHTGE